MAKAGAAVGKYGFTCGYCEAILDTPYDDAARAEQFAQQQGWRMTWGFSNRWGHGANNTCPDCLPLPGSTDEVLPIYAAR